MNVPMPNFLTLPSIIAKSQMKHEKYSKMIQYIETLPLNLSKLEKIPLDSSMFNQS
jgi:hypothetical protein